MTREHIIQLAKECGAFAFKAGDTVFDTPEQLEAFYLAAQREAYEKAADVAWEMYKEGPEAVDHAIRKLKEES